MNDCYQAYVWLVTHAKHYLGLDVDKWLLAGDSAGGHTSFSVSFLAMLRGFRVPDGLFTFYPSLVTSFFAFMPSVLLVVDEKITTHGFFLLASLSFSRNGGNPEKNCIMSPLIAPDSMIKLLPPCKFILAQNDTLRDHSFKMAIRILKLNGFCQIILYEDFSHGFLHLDNNYIGVDEYRRSTTDSIEHIKSLCGYIMQQNNNP